MGTPHPCDRIPKIRDKGLISFGNGVSRQFCSRHGNRYEIAGSGAEPQYQGTNGGAGTDGARVKQQVIHQIGENYYREGCPCTLVRENFQVEVSRSTDGEREKDTVVRAELVQQVLSVGCYNEDTK